MRLTTKTKYGVRALFDIAYHADDGESVQAKDVSRRESIPLRYLEQILQELKKAGLVDSKRGPKGGYSLRGEPTEIALGDVVRALEGPVAQLFCDGDDSGDCQSAPVTNDLWLTLSNHVREWLDAITIAELVAKGRSLGVPRENERKPMYFI